jgi:hypothetical protein
MQAFEILHVLRDRLRREGWQVAETFYRDDDNGHSFVIYQQTRSSDLRESLKLAGFHIGGGNAYDGMICVSIPKLSEDAEVMRDMITGCHNMTRAAAKLYANYDISEGDANYITRSFYDNNVMPHYVSEVLARQ